MELACPALDMRLGMAEAREGDRDKAGERCTFPDADPDPGPGLLLPSCPLLTAGASDVDTRRFQEDEAGAGPKPTSKAPKLVSRRMAEDGVGGSMSVVPAAYRQTHGCKDAASTDSRALGQQREDRTEQQRHQVKGKHTTHPGHQREGWEPQALMSLPTPAQSLPRTLDQR
jgi:hypothetical protein